MRYVGIACFVVSALLSTTTSASAASIQASPVLIDLAAPASASIINLRNTGDKAVKAQVRVFRWSSVAGKDQLTPTNDVVASPPILSLNPNADFTVRVVRTSKAPVSGEDPTA